MKTCATCGGALEILLTSSYCPHCDPPAGEAGLNPPAAAGISPLQSMSAHWKEYAAVRAAVEAQFSGRDRPRAGKAYFARPAAACDEEKTLPSGENGMLPAGWKIKQIDPSWPDLIQRLSQQYTVVADAMTLLDSGKCTYTEALEFAVVALCQQLGELQRQHKCVIRAQESIKVGDYVSTDGRVWARACN